MSGCRNDALGICRVYQMKCTYADNEKPDCECYREDDLRSDEYEDPCSSCDRDDCYRLLYGRCDRKGG